MKYRAGFKYTAAEDYRIQTPFADPIRPTVILEFLELSSDGLLLIRSGYPCDGPSGPTRDTANSIRGAFVHDALYQLLRLGRLPASLRPEVDVFFWSILREDGMWRVRAWLWWRAVDRFAGSAADPENIKPVLRAP